MVDGKKLRSKLGKMSRNKGKVGEREIAKILRARGFEAKRGVQHKGDVDSPDVISELTFLHIEVKRVEKLNIEDAFKQAANDAGHEKVPVVFHRKNNKQWLTTLSLFDFINLIQLGLNRHTDEINTLRRLVQEYKHGKKTNTGRRKKSSCSQENEIQADSELL